MKVKSDFITNSSSTAFFLTVYKDGLTAKEFVEKLFEHGIKSCMKSYFEDEEITQEDLINSLKQSYSEMFPAALGTHYVVFGDEQGPLAGRVFDYCLRGGFSNEKFMVAFAEHLR